MTPNQAETNWLKVLILAFFEILFAFLAVFFFKQFLLSADYGYFWLSLLTGFVFLIFTILNVFMVNVRQVIYITVLIQSAIPLTIFYPEFSSKASLLILGGAGVFLFFAAMGMNHGYRLLANSLRVEFFPVSRAILPKVTSGLLIFLSVLIYSFYFELGKFNDKLGMAFLDKTLKSSEPILRLWVENVSFDKAFPEFLKDTVTSQLQKNQFKLPGSGSEELSFDFKSLPPQVKTNVIAQVTAQVQSFIEEKVGPINKKLPLKQSLYLLIKDYFGKLTPNAKTMLAAAMTFLIFLSSRGISVLFYWLIELIAFIFFKLALVLNFVSIIYKPQNRESVVLN